MFFLKKINKKKLFLLVFFCCLLVIGTFFITLHSRYLRYNRVVPPVVVDIPPYQTYTQIKNNTGDSLLIDVRSPYEYNLTHAEGAVSMPINEMFDKWVTLPMNTNKQIYLICSSGRLAGVAYSFLEHQGFRNIKRVENGMFGWREKGLPIVVAKDRSSAASTSGPLNRGLDIPFTSD